MVSSLAKSVIFSQLIIFLAANEDSLPLKRQSIIKKRKVLKVFEATITDVIAVESTIRKHNAAEIELQTKAGKFCVHINNLE